MTARKKLTEVVIHKLDKSLRVRVIADTPAAAADLLAPFVTEDTYFAGTVTPRNYAVQTLLQDRVLRARHEMELANAAYQREIANIQHFARETEPKDETTND